MVAEELLAHLEDRRDGWIEQGLSPLEAERKTLVAMGNAEDIASQLAAVHTPWLGYLYAFTRLAAIITTCFALFLTTINGWQIVYNTFNANQFDSLPANYDTLDYYFYPKVSDSSDGRYYQVTEAGYCKTASEFYMEIRVIFWPQLRNAMGFSDFWAVDSLGNYYASRNEAGYDDIAHVKLGGSSSSACIGHYHLTITGFDCDAQWVELHYDRDDRDIVLRIDLTGGNEHE